MFYSYYKDRGTIIQTKWIEVWINNHKKERKFDEISGFAGKPQRAASSLSKKTQKIETGKTKAKRNTCRSG